MSMDNPGGASSGASSSKMEAEYIEDVAAYIARFPKGTEEALQTMQSTYQQYKLLESRLTQSRQRLMMKVPDVERTLACVKKLVQRKDEGSDTHVDFELTDGIFAKAKVSAENAQKVFLWLGANVALEYTAEEAVELLTKNLETAKLNLDTNRKDALFVKDCITTTEVSMARVYNYDVQQRKQKALETKE